MKITLRELRILIAEGFESLHGPGSAPPSPGGESPYDELNIWFSPAGVHSPKDIVEALRADGADQVARDLIAVLHRHASRR
jgi:hypothetical protein